MTSRSPEPSATVGAPAVSERANAEAVERICSAEPVLVDVRPALDVVPGMTRETILASGAPLAPDDYIGGQWTGVVGGALYEGLAADANEAEEKLRAGAIRIHSCQGHDCVGSLAGVYTATMPVLVVENAATGQRAFCNLFEG